MVRRKDGVFSENCRVIRKKETIMLQIADLMGSGEGGGKGESHRLELRLWRGRELRRGGTSPWGG